jgi:hypothetical protein
MFWMSSIKHPLARLATTILNPDTAYLSQSVFRPAREFFICYLQVQATNRSISRVVRNARKPKSARRRLCLMAG